MRYENLIVNSKLSYCIETVTLKPKEMSSKSEMDKTPIPTRAFNDSFKLSWESTTDSDNDRTAMKRQGIQQVPQVIYDTHSWFIVPEL